MTNPHHIFISYARRDGSEYAVKLDELLPQYGFATWRDKRGIDAAQDFTAEIENAIEAASYIVTCITPDVRREDSFVRREIGYALVVRKPVLVARFGDVTPPISVVNNTWIDFFTGWDSSFARLIDLLHGAPPSPKPAPAAGDPYQPYLEALYKQIVRYLDKTVFSLLPGQSNTSLISLRADSTPDAVAGDALEAQALPLAFFDAAGLGEDEKKSYGSVREAFDEHNGRLLLLGDPGSGKTTTLMAFARDAVAARLDDSAKPLPVLAPVSTWDSDRQTPLTDWLAGVVPALKDSVGSVLASGKALLLLDGLDELGEQRVHAETKEKYDPRPRFLNLLPANNQILLSCRVLDYQSIRQQAALNGAITLQPLDDAQLQAYLRDMPDLWDVLRADDELRAVARRPLLLSLFAYAFAGMGDEARGLHALDKGGLRDRVFETYVKRRYEHEARKKNAQLPFTLDEIYSILGQIAVAWILDASREANLLNYFNNTPSRSAARDITAFSELITRLNLVLPVENNTPRFIHLLLRDYFALPVALEQVQGPPGWDAFRAARVLGMLGDERAVSVLIDALANAKTISRDDDSVADEALNALTKIGKIEPAITCEALLNAADSPDVNIRFGVAALLGNFLDPRALEALAVLLDDTAVSAWNTTISWAAQMSIKNLGTPEAKAVLDAWEARRREDM